jgi:endonuclease YncB( thermonuclease family)
MDPAYVYRAEVLDVHDGDTYTVRVDLGFKTAITIQCRLHGVDTPELKVGTKPNPPGLAARDFVKVTLTNDVWLTYNPIVIQSYKDNRSFERWVCDVWLQDGRKLADVLLAEGHAKVI